jgi:hypothetical protein
MMMYLIIAIAAWYVARAHGTAYTIHMLIFAGFSNVLREPLDTTFISR